ncbi:uncharacterized protein BT62DRAFT_795821 [Guyanagaster necrorhizus]|uniref:Uncharacterized protein n=1 Tax=Guyanagaster necrorhizus TaxID=856835 RepID=A0A9P7VW76_9AGAR|nr:uncharacterized protein BT62DRAFT_795821 [Guyanagaster necrorhizus MCA 3950]KAG7447835.1 hypothetical protein BT62DRAFT_795821 [Guyanagaster necrorhizus MCA 3950]
MFPAHARISARYLQRHSLMFDILGADHSEKMWIIMSTSGLLASVQLSVLFIESFRASLRQDTLTVERGTSYFAKFSFTRSLESQPRTIDRSNPNPTTASRQPPFHFSSILTLLPCVLSSPHARRSICLLQDKCSLHVATWRPDSLRRSLLQHTEKTG